MLVPVGLGRGRTTSVGGALSAGGVLPVATAVAVAVVVGVVVTGAVVVGWVAHASSNAGEIIPAPITTDR
ncbi:MAG TPA: hypothetical protein VHS09_03945, partial [Polyangiaceae bacterium]|nr:hypothetical protein [Polyangiaceae bacterium]